MSIIKTVFRVRPVLNFVFFEGIFITCRVVKKINKRVVRKWDSCLHPQSKPHSKTAKHTAHATTAPSHMRPL